VAPPPRYERGYGRLFQDFLEHGGTVPEPEIH
jgi:hypothetical protein